MKKYLFSEFYIEQKDFLPLHALRTIALIQFIILHPLIGFAQYTDSKVIQSLAHNLFVCMDILFLLSGYFIYFSISKENLKNYYIKRFIRIIPTFYIAFILYFYLIHQELNKTSKIINLNSDNNQLLELYKALKLSIQYWWGDVLFISNYLPARIVNVGWAISTIVQVYIIFPLLIHFTNKFFKSYRILFWVFLYFLAILFRIYHYNNHFLEEKIYFMTHTRLDSFVIGILLAEFTLYYQDKKRIIQIPTLLRLMIILIFLFNFGYILLGDYYKIPLMNYVFKYNYYNLTFFFLVMYFILFENSKDWFYQLFNFNFYSFVSKISYTIFLFGDFFESLFFKNIHFFQFELNNEIKVFWIVTLIVFLILLDLILGWIFFLIFEKPFQMIKLKLNTK